MIMGPHFEKEGEIYFLQHQNIAVFIKITFGKRKNMTVFLLTSLRQIYIFR